MVYPNYNTSSLIFKYKEVIPRFLPGSARNIHNKKGDNT